MNTFEIFEWLLRSSFYGMVIIVGLALVGRYLPLASRWRFRLWILVFVQLGFPFLPSNALSIYRVFPDVGFADERNVYVEAKPILSHSRQGVGAQYAGMEEQHPPALKFLILVWFLGAVALVVKVVIDQISLLRAVSAKRQVTESWILELLENCKQEMGVNIPVALVIIEGVECPVLFGFIRPRILLPSQTIHSISRAELRMVFLHELAHVRRRDIVFNWIGTLLQILHWFNPVVWWGLRRMRSDRELACDELVLSTIGREESVHYGHTLLRLTEQHAAPRALPAIHGILEDGEGLRARVTAIASFGDQRSQYGFILAAVGILPILCLFNGWDYTKRTRSFHLVKDLTLVKKKTSGQDAFVFDGKRNFVSAVGDIGNFGESDFTISFWISSSSREHWNVIGKRPMCDAPVFWEVRGGGASGVIGLEMRSVANGELVRATINSEQPINDGKWHHVAFIREGSRLACFVNGSQESETQTPLMLNLANDSRVFVGVGPCVGQDETRLFDGELRSIKIFSRALNRAELTQESK